MNININLGNTQENITSEIILKLYLIATAADNTVTLSGNLYSPSGYAYQVDYLNAQFAPNLTITVPDAGKYIYFEDSAVEVALMNANVSTDGIGISVQDANRATLTSSTFAGNSAITSFNGFSYFTRANTNPPNNLFLNCSSLSQIDMSNITTIAQNEFRATALEDVNAPNLALLTGECLFADNQNLITITNLGNITSIPRYFAYNCKNLESVVLPQSCTTIVRNAFLDDSALSDINLSNITNIGDAAFLNCEGLAVNIADLLNCTSIGGYAFQNTKLIVGDVSLPSLLTTGYGIFRETRGIQKVTCLGKLQTIAADTFMNPKDQTSLTEVYLPYECASIGTKAFLNNTGLHTVKQYTTSVDNWIVGETPEATTALKILSIGNGAFYGCGLTSIDLSAVSSIEAGAFSNCKNLSTVIWGSVTQIPDGVFLDCSALSSVDMKFSDLTSIANNAFFDCRVLWGVLRYLLEYFTPTLNSNGRIADGAETPFAGCEFKQLYAPKLKASKGNSYYADAHWCTGTFGSRISRKHSVYGLLYLRDIQDLFPATFAGADITSLVINNVNVPVCYNRNYKDTPSDNGESKDSTFVNTLSTMRIYVPDSAVDAYKAADVWSTMASQIYPMSELTRYATEADWVAAGEPATGLIEAYM